MSLVSQVVRSVFICLSLSACAPTSPGDQAGAQPDHSQGSSSSTTPSNRIALPAIVRSNLGVTFAQVEARQVSQTMRIPGVFELQPRARREYRMSLPGRVELLVNQYEEVQSGQPLFRYQSPSWPELLHEIIEGEQSIQVARSEIEVSEAKLTEAQSKWRLLNERLDSLGQANFKNVELELAVAQTKASLPRIEAELRLANTRLQNAERTRAHALHRAAAAAGLSEEELDASVEVDGRSVHSYSMIDWIEVKASETGVVESLAVTDGAFVESPGLVLSCVNPKQLRFRANALQADLANLLGVTEARIVSPLAAGIAEGDGVAANLSIGLEAQADDRTVAVLASPQEPNGQFANKPWVRGGVAALLEVVGDSSEGVALAIPRSAIVQDGLEHVFFRRNPSDPNEVIRTEADMGVSDGRWVVLESGVARGDEVVLKGAYELKLVSQQSGVSSKGGHFHADGTFHGESD